MTYSQNSEPENSDYPDMDSETLIEDSLDYNEVDLDPYSEGVVHLPGGEQ